MQKLKTILLEIAKWGGWIIALVQNIADTIPHM